MGAFRNSPQSLRTSLISPEASPQTSTGSPQTHGGGGLVKSPEVLAQSPPLTSQATDVVMLQREDARLNAGLSDEAPYVLCSQIIIHFFIRSFKSR